MRVMREITYTKAINEAIDEEMERDATVFVMGLDVGKYWGNSLGEFLGLYDKWGPERIRQTPISETAIVGAGIGAAATGIRPIAVVMFADFLGVPMDEIINQLQSPYISGGQTRLPLTIPVYCGAGVSAGHHHSKTLHGLLMSIPGIKIVAPSTPYDAKGLLKTSIRDESPVIFFEHQKFLLSTSFKSQVPDEEYVIPLGTADIKREGCDVTVVATLFMVHVALAAAEKLQEKGISVEIIDPRTLIPFDKQAVIQSIKKTGKLVIMTEEPRTGSSASEIAATIGEEAFDYLDTPIKRICAPDTPIPFSPVLEECWIPGEDDLIKAVTEIM